jgi:hypothetical protein
MISTIFQFPDIFQCVASYFELRDIPGCSLVCTLWNRFISGNAFLWCKFSAERGIPLVEGENRNRKRDFQDLYSMTLSGSMTCKYLGDLVEKVPLISAVFLEILDAPDPYEPGKMFRQNFLFVVIPSRIRRINETELTIDAEGNLISDLEKQEKTIEVALTSKNLKMLCSYPLNGKENLPVFHRNHCAAFEQCAPYTDKISVYFMRKGDIGRDLLYDVDCCHYVGLDAREDRIFQKHLVKDVVGFKVTSLFQRTFANCLMILDSGTCFDVDFHYARTPDRGGHAYRLLTGGFVPKIGLIFSTGVFYDCTVGVVPGVPAEVNTHLKGSAFRCGAA